MKYNNFYKYYYYISLDSNMENKINVYILLKNKIKKNFIFCSSRDVTILYENIMTLSVFKF